ncbi:MAG: WD40 repeat domain-containing protein [Rickettsiales bacterium]|nr:WD40 repeat domain-containing protein [Rickettsiales bacterium]
MIMRYSLGLILSSVIATASQALAQSAAPSQSFSPASWNTAPPYVQRYELGAATGSDVFDDIVRFKTRAQLATADDGYNFAYKGPEIIAAMGDHLRVFSYQCGRLVPGASITGASYALPHASAQVAFTPGNRHIFTYEPALGRCNLYTVSGTTVTALGAVTGADYATRSVVIQSCPASPGSTNPISNIAMSDNGYLAISKTASPYVEISKLSGNMFYALAPVASPGARPSYMSFTGDGMLFVASDGSSTNTKVYAQTQSSKFIQLGSAPYNGLSQPASMPTSPKAVSFSPDGRYLAMPYTTGSSVFIHIWRIDDGNKFVKLTNTVLADTNAYLGISASGTQALVNAFVFSQDSKYLAIAGSDSSYANNYLVLYKIDSGDIFTPVTVRLGGYETADATRSISAIAFAPDSSYMIVSLAYTGSNTTRQPSIIPVNRVTPTVWGAFSSEQVTWSGTYMPRIIAVRR